MGQSLVFRLLCWATVLNAPFALDASRSRADKAIKEASEGRATAVNASGSVGLDAKLSEGRQALMSDPAKALQIAADATNSARSIDDAHLRAIALAKANWLTSAALMSSGRSAESVAPLQSALRDEKALVAEPKLLGDLYMAMATANGLRGRTEEALYGLQRAYNYFRVAHELRSESLVLQNIGTMYFIARDFDQALKYYDRANAAFASDPATRTTLLINRGNVLKEQDKAPEAARAFEQSAALAASIKSPTLEALALTNLAATQLLANDIVGAERTIARGLAVAEANPSAQARLAPIYAVQAEAAFKQGQLDRAQSLIEKAFARFGATGSRALLRDFERTAYDIYRARGDQPRALVHLERFKQLDDQARALAASTNAALISARFDFANQNARIAQLRQNEAEQEAVIQRNRVIFQRRLLSAAAVILVLLLIGFLSIRRSRNQVRAANDELTGTNHELERALAARTEFLATTSHEIRTPLNGILGMTQVLLADRGLAPDVKNKIELVQGAGETMKALVDDILDVAKLTNGELQIHRAEMDLGRLLRDAVQVWEAQATTKGVVIEHRMADAPDRIVEDEVRLRQIVFNLMANAVKFTDRGAVRLMATFVPDGDETATGGTLRIAISDTGIGMPADRLEEIFESFRQIDGGTTRRHGGTGLGLAICRNLARAMGGDVTVSSVLGAGSTFTIELPCERVIRVAKTRAASGALEGAGVLLVEANPLARSILTAVLTPVVGRLMPTGEAEEAERLLESDSVDLMVVDGGALGLDMTRVAELAAKAIEIGTATVLLWPSPGDDVIQMAGDAGILRIIAKPIAAQELVAALKDIYMTERSPEEIAA